MLKRVIENIAGESLDEDIVEFLDELQEKSKNTDETINNILTLNKKINLGESILDLLNELSYVNADEDDIIESCKILDIIIKNGDKYDLEYLKEEDPSDILDFLLDIDNDIDDLDELYTEMQTSNDISYVVLHHLNQFNIDSEMLIPTYKFMQTDGHCYSDDYADTFYTMSENIFHLGDNKADAAREWYTQTALPEVSSMLDVLEETIDIDWEENFDNVFEGMDVLELGYEIYVKHRY